jgi:hypothetical protein
MLDDKRSDLDTLKKKMNSLQDHEAFEKLISEYQAQLDEFEILRKNQHQTNNSTKQAMLGEIQKFVQYYTELKAYEEKSLQDLKQYGESREKFTLTLSKEDQNLLKTL